jgi:NAD(P)-dependent dehydrogenase (short-subunit alcohol dehydrogenase family)
MAASRASRILAMLANCSRPIAPKISLRTVAVNCCCPGFNVTGLGRELPFAGVLARVLTRLKIGDPRRGAGIIVRLATDPAFAGITGGSFAVEDAKPL